VAAAEDHPLLQVGTGTFEQLFGDAPEVGRWCSARTAWP